MRAAHLRPSSRLSAFILFCLLAMSPMFAVHSAATTLSISGVPPSGTVGVTYAAFPLGVSGGTAPYYWTVSVGAPPPGLVLGTATISGKPITAGTYPFTIKVTDSSAVQNVGTAAMSITINPAASAVTLPTTLSFPNATVGQPYSAGLAASGGSLPTYLWTVNNIPIPTNGSSVTLPGGLQFLSTSGPDLNIGGTPTAAGLVTFTLTATNVACTQGCGTTGPTATATYSINVGTPSYAVNGQIFLNNNCGNSTLPPMKVSINTKPVQTTTTDGNGNFSFQNVPNGTYTITPSITGASSVFYPATQSVVVSGNNVYAGFNAALGYTVTGTVNYSGTKTGRVYVVLNGNNCGGSSTSGTSISAKGSFTIHGVPPGSYTAQAWMDTLGFESPNASDPAGSNSNLTVSAANLTGVAVTLADPSTVALSSAPTLQMVSPFAGGALVQFKALQSNNSNSNNNNNGNGTELATSYTLEWSTTSSFTAVTGSHTYAATGTNGNNIWLLKGLTEGAIYYFRAQGLAGSSKSPWSTPIGPVTIAAPKAANTVSGTVTFPGTATGPLYVGFYDSKTNNVYADVITSPSSPQLYSVEVPTGSNYQFFGIIDQNNDGLVDAGDITNVNGNNGPPAAVITASKTGENLTLSSADSTVSLATQHGRQTNQYGTSDWYNLNFNVNGLTKLPVAVTLESGPNLITPMDIGNGNGNGGFSFWPSLNNIAPKVGDTYTLLVTYSDTTTQTLTAKVGAVLSAFATKMAPAGSTSTLASLKPTFTWTDPASPTLYTYQFQLSDNNGNQIWQIPGNNSNSNGFPSTVTSLVWGTDPTGGGSTPSVSSLTLGAMYNWQIQAQDANGNSSVMQVSYQPGGELPLTLPAPDPGTLGPAIIGQPYSGTINASGGSPCYNWTVTGLSDNLGWGSNCNALTINGTPTVAETVSFQVKVSDNQGHSYGPVTYTIHVAASAPLSFNTTQSDVPVAVIDSPYELYFNVSGGVPPYKFTTASGSIPSTLSYLATSHELAGTPTAAGSFSFEVKVTDSALNTVTSKSLTVTVDSAPNHQHDAWLSGTYVCQVSGFNDSDNTFWTLLSSFPTTGASTFSGGVLDKNSADSGPVSGTLAGTVNIGADNTGLMTYTVTPAVGKPNTFTYAVTLNGLAAAPATEFHGVEIDDIGATPSGQHSMADCYRTTPTTFTASTISGHSFAFGLGGVNGNGTPKNTVGQFIAGPVVAGTTGGAITGGEVDQGKGYNNPQNGTLKGTYTIPNAASGRYTMTLTESQGSVVNGTANFVNYIIDAKRQLMLMFDTGDGPQSGNVRTQQQPSYSNANLDGPFVVYFHEHGFNPAGNVDGFASNLFQGKGNGTTGFTINQSFQDKVNTLGLPGTYDPQGSNSAIQVTVASNGRVAFNPGDSVGAVYLYLYDNNSAFIMDASGGNLGLGWIEAQTLPAITDTTLAGSYELGTMFPLASYIQDDIGHLTLGSLSSPTASGTLTGTSTSGQQGEFSWDSPWPSGITYAWTSTADGTFQLSAGGSPALSCIYVTATPSPKFVCIMNTSSTAEVEIAQQ